MTENAIFGQFRSNLLKILPRYNYLRKFWRRHHIQRKKNLQDMYYDTSERIWCWAV